MKIIATILFALLLTQSLSAQVQVNSFSPSNGSTSVDLNTDVSITFNQAISQWESFENLFERIVPFPMDSVSITNATLSEDKLTVTFTVEHTANTDFTWIIIGIEAESGEEIDKPYAFTYTTKSSFSTNTVSGSFYERDLFGITRKTTAKTAKNISLGKIRWLNANHHSTYAKPISPELAELDFSFGLVMLTTVQPDLFSDDEDGEDEGSNEVSEEMPSDSTGDGNGGDGPPEGIVYAGTISETGEFELPHIENGSYYVVGYLFNQYVDEDDGKIRTEPYAIGYYDVDEDFEADVVTVEDADVTGVSVGLFNFDLEFSGYSIDDIYEKTVEDINEFFGTNKILFIRGLDSVFDESDDDDEEDSEEKFNSNQIKEMIAPTGLAYAWGFGIYVPDSAKIYNVIQSPLGLLYFDDESDNLITSDFENVSTFTSLPMNSTEAIQIAEANGGSTFRATAPDSADAEVEMIFISDVDIFDEKPENISGTVWLINYMYEYYDLEQEEYIEDEISVIINAFTKEVLFSGSLETSIENTSNKADSYQLLQNYPNPFNPSTTIAFNLPKASNTRVQIYNGLGQLVSTLVDQSLSSGKHSYNFDASSLSSGVYFYTIKADHFVQTKKMTLIK